MMPPWGKTGSLFNYQQCGLVHFSIIIDAYGTDWLTFQLSTAQLVHFSIIIDVHGKSWLTFQLENGSVFIPSFSSFSLKLVTISIKNWFTIHLTKTPQPLSKVRLRSFFSTFPTIDGALCGSQKLCCFLLGPPERFACLS